METVCRSRRTDLAVLERGHIQTIGLDGSSMRTNELIYRMKSMLEQAARPILKMHQRINLDLLSQRLIGRATCELEQGATLRRTAQNQERKGR